MSLPRSTRPSRVCSPYTNSTTAPALQIALGWHVFTANNHDVVWHDGGTGGYRSFVGFDLAARTAVVALSNAGTLAG